MLALCRRNGVPRGSRHAIEITKREPQTSCSRYSAERVLGIEPSRHGLEGRLLAMRIPALMAVPTRSMPKQPSFQDRRSSRQESNLDRSRTGGEHDHRAARAWWRCRELNPQNLLAKQVCVPTHIPVGCSRSATLLTAACGHGLHLPVTISSSWQGAGESNAIDTRFGISPATSACTLCASPVVLETAAPSRLPSVAARFVCNR